MAKILVIDDDSLAREAMAISLQDDGHTVFMAKDGAVGVKMADEQNFDVVVTDVVMPNKEGLGTLMDIKQNHQYTKVIVVSGGGRSSPALYLDTAKVMGADGILAKPFSSSELQECVAQALV